MSNEGLRKQIYGNLRLKETDELLGIWQANDHSEWSEEAFEVVKELLEERGVEIPQQNEPIYKREEETSEDDGLEEWEIRLLEEENQPDFYDTLEVLSLRDNLNRVAVAAVIVYALIAIFNIPAISLRLSGVHLTLSDLSQFWLETLITILNVGLKIAVTYFSLKALTHILRILMEMEFRSRRGTQHNPVVE